ncbi:aminoglycoside phosphotransferase family protein [Hamadaea tsunoensis]|uniref:aminoglycoside phosphotransferase family protein n=1 Tax=Hamadaea tsunoensis TaxID=53368 RepID=UPI0004111F7E|nr:aminoglycoside phosphotransferase family protein [Hamadaea tsunoensis]
MPRTVTLVLADATGRVLGALPPFEVELPWWQESAQLVAGARELHGAEVTVLRLLDGDRPAPPGGAVRYLAQSAAPVPGLSPVDLELTSDPRRTAYAEIGGPARTLDWARGVIGPFEARQIRTWNLSAIWRLDTADGHRYWIKEVPGFFGHEPAMLGWLADRGFGPAVPRLVAVDGHRMLLEDIPGEDLYSAGPGVREAIVAAVHPIQRVALDAADELLALGVPDRRSAELIKVITAVVDEHGDDPRLTDLVAGLPERFAAVAGCGVPETLLHGDLHPGNARGDAGHLTILDWGDCSLAHPAFDILRLTERTGPEETAALIGQWADLWRETVPGCEPERAVELLRPVVALRHAAVYAEFLRNIELSEWPYHVEDVPFWLSQAAGLA